MLLNELIKYPFVNGLPQKGGTGKPQPNEILVFQPISNRAFAS